MNIMNYKKIFKTFFNKETIFIYVIGLVLFAAGVFCYEKARHAPRTFDKYFFQSATQGDGNSLFVADADKIASPTDMPVKKISREDATACVLKNKNNTYKIYYNLYREIVNSSVDTYVLSTDFYGSYGVKDISYDTEKLTFDNSSKSLSITMSLSSSNPSDAPINISIPNSVGWKSTGKRNQQVYRGVIDLTSSQYANDSLSFYFSRFPVGYPQVSNHLPIWQNNGYYNSLQTLANIDTYLYYRNNPGLLTGNNLLNSPFSKLTPNDPFFSTLPVYLNYNNEYYNNIWGVSNPYSNSGSTPLTGLIWTFIGGDQSPLSKSQNTGSNVITQNIEYKQKSIIQYNYNENHTFSSGSELNYLIRYTGNC